MNTIRYVLKHDAGWNLTDVDDNVITGDTPQDLIRKAALMYGRSIRKFVGMLDKDLREFSIAEEMITLQKKFTIEDVRQLVEQHQIRNQFD